MAKRTRTYHFPRPLGQSVEHTTQCRVGVYFWCKRSINLCVLLLDGLHATTAVQNKGRVGRKTQNAIFKSNLHEFLGCVLLARILSADRRRNAVTSLLRSMVVFEFGGQVPNDPELVGGRANIRVSRIRRG